MDAMAKMIIHNLAGEQTPKDTQRLVDYARYVLQGNFNINRAKRWHDNLFRRQYTTCSRTLSLLKSIPTREMARHVFSLESTVPMTIEYLMGIESIVRRLMDAGLWMVWTHTSAEITTDPAVVFKGGQIEVILEGRPFEQEYVTDLSAFNAWLDTRLPRVHLCK
jgi:hypothetical protein